MARVREILGDLRFDMDRYYQESFSFADLSDAVVAEVEALEHQAMPAAGQFTVRFQGIGRQIECGPETTILDAAKANGIFMPHGCANGMCGTCKAMRIAGEVAMTHSGGIRQRDIDRGFILPCCACPLSEAVQA